VLCVFGRGIEKDESGIWQPTTYLEETTPDNQHGGQRKEGLHMDSDSPQVVVAGAHANVMAASHIWNKLSERDREPEVVVFAAGRPKYLFGEPEDKVWEGSPLYRVMSENCVGLDFHSEIVFQKNNRNTRDDLIQTLRMARSRNLKSVAVISVLVHLRRIAEFFKFALIEDKSLAEIDVKFCASELVLLGNGDAERLLLIDDPKINGPLDHLALARIIESPVFRRTAAKEEKGINDLREGRYKFS